METKANYVVVGAFTLAVVIACFAFILWVSGFSNDKELMPLEIKIFGSASGLSEGSLLLFNGVKVGSVDRISLDVDNPNIANVIAQINRFVPLRADTKASLSIQGFTGGATIELTGGTVSAPNILDVAEQEGEIAQIVAEPSTISSLLSNAQTIGTRADRVLEIFEELAIANKETINNTVKNVELVSQTVADNRENIDSFMKSAGAVANTLDGLSTKIDGTVKALEKITNAISPDDITAIVSNVESFSEQLVVSAEQIDETVQKVDGIVAAIEPDSVKTIVSNVRDVSGELKGVAQKVEGTLTKVDDILTAVDNDKIASTLDNVVDATDAAKEALNNIAKTAEVIGDSNEDVEAIFANVRSMTERLNNASDKVENVLVSLDGLLGADETKGLVGNTASTVIAYRKLAEDLRAQVNEISKSIKDFSNRGLKDVRALVSTSERSIKRIERAITKVGNNPSSILGGGSGVREYSGRPRR